MKNTVEEFKKSCDRILARPKMSKKILAQDLGVDADYFSKLYNAKRPIASKYFFRLHAIENSNSRVHSIRETPAIYGSGDVQQGEDDEVIKQILTTLLRLEGKIEDNTKMIGDCLKRIATLESKKVHTGSHM